jgi:hypothetical protein
MWELRQGVEDHQEGPEDEAKALSPDNMESRSAARSGDYLFADTQMLTPRPGDSMDAGQSMAN